MAGSGDPFASGTVVATACGASCEPWYFRTSAARSASRCAVRASASRGGSLAAPRVATILAAASATARSEKIATVTVVSINACPRSPVRRFTQLDSARIDQSGAPTARRFKGQAVAGRKDEKSDRSNPPATASSRKGLAHALVYRGAQKVRRVHGPLPSLRVLVFPAVQHPHRHRDCPGVRVPRWRRGC